MPLESFLKSEGHLSWDFKSGGSVAAAWREGNWSTRRAGAVHGTHVSWPRSTLLAAAASKVMRCHPAGARCGCTASSM
jgi:hypothetical protein